MEGDTQGSTTEGTVVAMNMTDFWKVKVVDGALEGACIVLFTSWASPFNITSGMISSLNINIVITSTPVRLHVWCIRNSVQDGVQGYTIDVLYYLWLH